MDNKTFNKGQWRIPEKYQIMLALLVLKLPKNFVIKGRVVNLQKLVADSIQDGSIGIEDLFNAIISIMSDKHVPGVVENKVPLPHDDGGEPVLVMPDRLEIHPESAMEPGLDEEGQRTLLATSVYLKDDLVVVGGHEKTLNDATKVWFAIALFKGEKQLHLDQHPHLIGAVRWIAEDANGNELGAIGGRGLADLNRNEHGVGWGGQRYVEERGMLAPANFMEPLKGKTCRIYAEVGKVRSNVLRTATIR